MAEAKKLETAVKAEVKDAKAKVTTGNQQTIKETPTTLRDAATGEHSRR
jgi:hypothetical protein